MSEAKYVLTFTYTNHNGETGRRRVIPQSIRFVATGYDPVPRWRMLAFCLDRQALRDFTLADMKDQREDCL